MPEIVLTCSTNANTISEIKDENFTISNIKIGNDVISIVDNKFPETIPDSLKTFIKGGSLVNKTNKRKRIRKRKTRGKR